MGHCLPGVCEVASYIVPMGQLMAGQTFYDIKSNRRSWTALHDEDACASETRKMELKIGNGG